MENPRINKLEIKDTSIIKKGVDFVFEQNPELLKIGTKEQYSNYIDTIFPGSKIKDIVYHGTKQEKIENFEANFIENRKKDILKEITELKPSPEDLEFLNSIDIYESSYSNPYFNETKRYRTYRDDPEAILGDNTEEAKKILRFRKYNERQSEYNEIKNTDQGFYFAADSEKAKSFGNTIVCSVLNIQKPKIKELGILRWQEVSKPENCDSIIGESGLQVGNKYSTYKTYVVFDPHQIHILGSQSDIEGFKKYIESIN